MSFSKHIKSSFELKLNKNYIYEKHNYFKQGERMNLIDIDVGLHISNNKNRIVFS